MKHIDGISVYLTRPGGSRFSEWPNVRENRHPGFDGTFGSRRIVAPVGKPFDIVVEFAPTFKLYSATGVQIVVVIGDKSSQLSRDANGQIYWLDASYIDIRQKHRFPWLKIWERERSHRRAPDGYLPLEIPGPHPNYATADAEWMMKNVCEANTGSIAVWIRRMKTKDNDYNRPPGEQRDITDPPDGHRIMNTGWPKVIQGQWCKHLLNTPNGREYVFEFVNMKSDAVDQALPEASPEFGHDDEQRYAHRDAHTEFAEEEWSEPHDPWGNQEYLDDMEFAASDPAPNKPGRGGLRGSHLLEPSSKRRRMDTLADRTASEPTLMTVLRSEAVQTTSKVYDNQDDEEELPTARAPEVKEEPKSERESSRTHEPTPPAEQPQGRETTTELYGVTPERDRPIDLTADDDGQVEVKRERVPEHIDQGHNNELDEEERLERAIQLEEIETRKHQLKLAELRAKLGTLKRRKQSQGRPGPGTPSQRV